MFPMGINATIVNTKLKAASSSEDATQRSIIAGINQSKNQITILASFHYSPIISLIRFKQ